MFVFSFVRVTTGDFLMPWKSRAGRKPWKFAMELGLPWRFGTGALELWNQEPKVKSVAKAVYHCGKNKCIASTHTPITG